MFLHKKEEVLCPWLGPPLRWIWTRETGMTSLVNTDQVFSLRLNHATWILFAGSVVICHQERQGD